MITLFQLLVITLLIAVFMGFCGVFVLRWLTKLIDAFKALDFYAVCKGIIAFIFACFLAKIGEDVFKAHIVNVSGNYFVILGVFTLAAMQLIFENYKKVEAWLTDLLKRKIDKEVMNAPLK